MHPDGDGWDGIDGVKVLSEALFPYAASGAFSPESSVESAAALAVQLRLVDDLEAGWVVAAWHAVRALAVRAPIVADSRRPGPHHDDAVGWRLLALPDLTLDLSGALRLRTVEAVADLDRVDVQVAGYDVRGQPPVIRFGSTVDPAWQVDAEPAGGGVDLFLLRVPGALPHASAGALLVSVDGGPPMRVRCTLPAGSVIHDADSESEAAWRDRRDRLVAAAAGDRIPVMTDLVERLRALGVLVLASAPALPRLSRPSPGIGDVVTTPVSVDAALVTPARTVAMLDFVRHRRGVGFRVLVGAHDGAIGLRPQWAFLRVGVRVAGTDVVAPVWWRHGSSSTRTSVVSLECDVDPTGPLQIGLDLDGFHAWFDVPDAPA